jgi:hypothetical protein
MLWMTLSGTCVPRLLFRKIGQAQGTAPTVLPQEPTEGVPTEGVMAGNGIDQGWLWLIGALRRKENQFMIVLSWNRNFMEIDLLKAVL